MAELAVAVSSLALILISTQALAALQETQRRMLVAVRHATFSRVWGAEETEGGVSVEGLYSMHLDDPGMATPLTGERHVEVADLQLYHEDHQLEGAAAASQRLLHTSLSVPGNLLSREPDWGSEGFIGVQLKLHQKPLRELPEPFGELDLEFHEGMLVLADSWDAADSRRVVARSGALVPTHLLRPLSTALRPVLIPLRLLEPTIDRLCLGLIDADGVPDDRLGPARSRAPTWNSCR